MMISIRYRYIDHLVANRMAASMCGCGVGMGNRNSVPTETLTTTTPVERPLYQNNPGKLCLQRISARFAPLRAVRRSDKIRGYRPTVTHVTN